jgi:hypothetical protein
MHHVFQSNSLRKEWVQCMKIKCNIKVSMHQPEQIMIGLVEQPPWNDVFIAGIKDGDTVFNAGAINHQMR